MKECNITNQQYTDTLAHFNELKDKEVKLNKEYEELIAGILERCENETMSFTDSDDDENFVITIPNDDGEFETRLVNSISLKKFNGAITNKERKHVIITDENNADWTIWETGLSLSYILNYMMDEIQMELAGE